MKVIVLGNADREGVTAEAKRLLPEIQRCCQVELIDLHQEASLAEGVSADLAIVLGGDGAMLRAARQLGYAQIPVLGINLGRLGFLADLDPDQMVECLPQVIEGHFQVTKHIMFECVVEEAGTSGTCQPRKTFLGLNEISFHTLPPFPILALDLSIDGELAAHFRGDGLILSTPIGATAHSLSAGGPILGQELSAFVITPICPHALTHRPVVESAGKEYTIAIAGGSEKAALVVDGQDLVELTKEHRVTFRKAPVQFQLVRVPGRSFYHTLKDKLNWGALPRFRHEQKGD